jgi:anaerobic dimethyl sulfoxide reductase subunit B (iron-sulfur subunit)
VAIDLSGIATKCDGCADEVDSGLDPTCVRACPMRALQYGRVEKEVAACRTEDDRFDDHGIGPSVSYLRRVPDGDRSA